MHSLNEVRKGYERAVREDEKLPMITGGSHPQMALYVWKAPGWHCLSRGEAISGDADGTMETNKSSSQNCKKDQSDEPQLQDQEGNA